MKIGFNMLLWGPKVTPDQAPLFADLKRTGYDGVEVPVAFSTIEGARSLARVLDDVGLERTAHTVMPNGTNPLSDDAAERQAAVDHIEASLDRGAALGATLLVGPIHQVLNTFTGVPTSAVEWERGCAFHRAVGDHAAARGMTIAIEAMNRFEAYFLNTMAELTGYLDRVNHPAVSGLFDSFHANVEELDMVATLAPSRRHLAHVHISENDRGVPGRGHVPWPRLFAELKRIGYDGWLTVEAFSRASPEFAFATRVWRELADSHEEVYREGYRLIRSGWSVQ